MTQVDLHISRTRYHSDIILISILWYQKADITVMWKWQCWHESEKLSYSGRVELKWCEPFFSNDKNFLSFPLSHFLSIFFIYFQHMVYLEEIENFFPFLFMNIYLFLSFLFQQREHIWFNLKISIIKNEFFRKFMNIFFC